MNKITTFIKKWQGQLMVIFFSYVVLDILAKVPYMNVVLRPQVIIASLFFLSIYLFKVREDQLLGIALLAVLTSTLAEVIGAEYLSELAGNVIIVTIFLWLAFCLRKYFKRRFV